VSRETWERHVRAQRESGLSHAAYCRKHSLKKDQYYYWKRRIGNEPTSKGHFVPLGSSSCIELEIGEIKIKVPSGFDSEELKRVVEALC
jgi:hypothetical protein